MINFKISVIIPTRNHSEYLAKALQAIHKQTLDQNQFEVIVVDNGSTDNTKDVIESFVLKIPNLNYFYEQTPGLHVGRHKGLNEAKSDILVYADDDIIPFPTWLETIVSMFDNKDVVLAGGKNLPRFEEAPPEWLERKWAEKISNGQILGYLSILDFGNKEKKINPYHVFGCNFAIRKSILIDAGGFHPDGMPQELIRFRGDGESHISKYILDNGYQTMYHPAASVYHFVSKTRMTKEYFYKRSFNQGISDSYTMIRNKENIYKKKLSILKLKLSSSFLAQFERKLQNAYCKGFIYHQNEIKKDRSLYDWVIKKYYCSTN